MNLEPFTRTSTPRAPASSPSQRRIERAPAFTLLELLIAVVAFAIVLLAINAVFYGALRLRNKSAQSIEANLPLQKTVAILKRDLANLVPPGGTLAGPLQTGSITNLLPGQTSPIFYSSTGALDDLVPWGDVQQICYLLVPSTNRAAPGKDLIRAVRRNLLALTPEAPAQQWLMSGVQEMTFQFFDGAQWLAGWDSTVQTNLPAAIKVQLELTSDNLAVSHLNPIELIVPIDAQARTNLTQQPTTTTGG